MPLRHAPPFYGNSLLRFQTNKWHIETSIMYNSEVNNKNLAPSEKGKLEIYALDKNGMPYSPAWYTLNLKSSYQMNKHFVLTAGWENITNRRYRPYSSGIVAAGSNLIFSLRIVFWIQAYKNELCCSVNCSELPGYIFEYFNMFWKLQLGFAFPEAGMSSTFYGTLTI